MSGKKQGTHLILGPTELTALRDIRAGLSMFVPARQTDFLIAHGLVSRQLGGGPELTAQGLQCLKEEREDAGREL
jgi:hypothetical protein